MRSVPLLCALALIMVGSRTSLATVIAVPLPELLGVYLENGKPNPGQRTTTFNLPAMPSAVHSVAIRLRGTATIAIFSCDGPDGYTDSPYPTQTAVDMFAEPGHWLVESVNSMVPGAFEWTQTFAPYLGATWSFLLDGSGQIWLGVGGTPPIPECFPVGPGADVTLEEVTLLVDGEFPTPVRNATWGRVKAQYR